MVDFRKMHEDWYNGLDPEARARVDARREHEARMDLQSKTIDGHFQRIGWATHPEPGGRRTARRSDDVPERSIEAEWTRPLKVRIEDRENNDGSSRDILAFHGAVTGHEAYSLDRDLVASLEEMAADGTLFCICGGTPTRYDACHVSAEDVLDLIREHRPELCRDRPAAALSEIPSP